MNFINNISISKKITIAVVLVFVPSVVLMWLMYQTTQTTIESTQNELRGLTYLRGVQDAMIEAAKDNASEINAAAAAVAIEKAEREDGGALNLTKESAELVNKLKAPGAKDFEQLTTDIANFAGLVGDNSGITLDPDVDTYYLGDMLTNQLFAILSNSVNVRTQARKLIANPAENDNAFVVPLAGFEVELGALKKDGDKAMGYNDGLKDVDQLHDKLLGQLDWVVKAGHAQNYANIPAAVNAIQQGVNQFSEAVSKRETDLFEARIAKVKAVLYERMGLVGGFFLIGGLLVFIILRSITKPLATITGLMGELTKGNLGIEVPKMKRGDEIGVLNTSLESMHVSATERQRAQVEEAQRLAKEAKRAELIQNTIQQFESKIQGIVSTVAAAATELAHTAQQMTKIMKAASDNTTNAVATASETAGNVSSVAAAAEEMAASVREISSQVQKTNELVKDSQGKTIAADEKANALSEASAKVRDAVMLISTISSKINLLALNATIESARAGEAGRGFAVVASEVKVLANQTNQSLEDIGKVIEGMDSASSEITKALTNIKDSVEQVSSASNSIAAAVEEQSATTNEITRNMQNAAQGTNLISENLGTVNDSSSEATAAANEVLSAAEELSRQAEALNREVNDFLEVIKAA